MTPEPPSSSPADAAQTVNLERWIYGDAAVALDDPAEALHEASKLNAASVDHRAPGGRLLARSHQMRVTATRAVKRHPQAGRISLPAPRRPAGDFWTVLDRRRSERVFGHRPLLLADLAGLLAAGYGVTSRVDEPAPQALRTVPSGGALYPLELYAVVRAVDGLRPGLYHFDPLRTLIELIRVEQPDAALERLTVYPELFVGSAVVLFVTAMFWRTRFKYGLRGYRFALLEAGHVGQNIMLAATALDLAAVPVGGFYDRRVDRFLDVDGVNESAVYALSVGSRAAA